MHWIKRFTTQKPHRHILIYSLFLANAIHIASAETTRAEWLYRQDFQSISVGGNWDDLTVQKSSDANHVGLVEYVPSSKGSPRITGDFSLNESVQSATLSYKVKFSNDFEWVRGGKLHGLGGGTTTTGCDDADPNGWSARIMWRKNGVPEIYLYDQTRTGGCGRSYPPNVEGEKDFAFSKGQWHTVELYVQLNSSPSLSDGLIELYVDGRMISQAKALRISGRSNIHIDTFMLSTFYGGNDSGWSPSKTTSALFDNFIVQSGKKIIGKCQSEDDCKDEQKKCGVSASHEQDPNYAELAFDKNLDSRWSSEGLGQWIQYDFGSLHHVTSVDISFYQGDVRAAYFEIIASKDGVNWEKVYTGQSSGESIDMEHFDFTNINARYMRIIGHGNSANSWNSFTEIQFFGVKG